MSDASELTLAILRKVAGDIADISLRQQEMQLVLDQQAREISQLGEQLAGNINDVTSGLAAKLATIASCCGEIYAQINNDSALPEHILRSELMEDFVSHYPENIPKPYESQIQALAKLSEAAPLEKLAELYQSIRANARMPDNYLTKIYISDCEHVLAAAAGDRWPELFAEVDAVSSDKQLEQAVMKGRAAGR